MNNGCAALLLFPSRVVWPDCSAGWRRSSPSGVDSETPGRSTSSHLTPSNIYHWHLWLHPGVTARLNNISGLYPHCHTLKRPLTASATTTRGGSCTFIKTNRLPARPQRLLLLPSSTEQTQMNDANISVCGQSQVGD